jgi:hypothetical protein
MVVTCFYYHSYFFLLSKAFYLYLPSWVIYLFSEGTLSECESWNERLIVNENVGCESAIVISTSIEIVGF